MNRKIVTVIQARTGSTRMPNKVLFPLGNSNVLLYMIERVKQSKLCGDVIVATTNKPEDDGIELVCEVSNIDCYRGHPTDLLDRHYRAVVPYVPAAVVKIPSDCPLIDPEIIDKVIEYYLDNRKKFDYVSNLHPQSYPDGNDVEIFSFSALSKAWRHAKKDFEREHTTPFFWENPEEFRIGNVAWVEGLDYSMSHRWTLDYPEDYDLIKKIVDRLHPSNPYFGLDDIIRLMDRNPEYKYINSMYLGVNWYRNHLNELKTIDASQTKLIA
jgi:spore coat polysaccharide biosynthesis protein SpsF